MRKHGIIEVVLAVAIVGCLTGCEEAKSRALRIIRRDAEAYRTALASGCGGYLDLERHLLQQIRSLPDAELRYRCSDELKTLVFSIDLQRLSAEPSKVTRCRKGLHEIAIALTDGRLSRSGRESWEPLFRYLLWLREQTKKLEAVALDYPPGVTCWLDLSGDPHLKTDKANSLALKEYQGVLRSYDSCAVGYETFVRWCERVVPNWLKGNEERIERTKTLEGLLGRRLRTKAECDADRKVKRRLEFPYLVLTPDGVHKEWTKEMK